MFKSPHAMLEIQSGFTVHINHDKCIAQYIMTAPTGRWLAVHHYITVNIHMYIYVCMYIFMYIYISFTPDYL